MMLFAFFLFLCLCLSIGSVSAQSSVVPMPSDQICYTLGRSSRDPATETNVYLRKRDQSCRIGISGGGTGLFTYSLNKKNVPIIINAMVFVSLTNLDKGSPTTASSSVYAIKLGGLKSIPGMILGSTLGGDGNDPTNVFPISPEASTVWRSLETAVYNCIKSGKSSSAKLRWIFYYQTASDTRPFKAMYLASFVGGANNCEKIVESINL